MRITAGTDLSRLGAACRAQVRDLVPRGTTTGRRKRRERPEQVEGAALVKWIDLIRLPDGTRPGEFFAHVPNGGARTAVEGAILKSQGVRAGHPDYILDLARGGYHGLRLELKAPDGDPPTAAQAAYLDRLREQGYYGCVARGWIEASQVIDWYIKLPPSDLVTGGHRPEVVPG